MDQQIKSHKKATISVVIMIIFVVTKLYFGYIHNRLPEGLSSTDEVMTYLGKHEKSDEQISMTSAMAQLGAGSSELQDQTKNDPVIFIMENKKTGRYVFKYKDRFVYFVAGIKKDSEGKLYVKELNAKTFDDSDAKETDGYSILEYNRYYGLDDD